MNSFISFAFGCLFFAAFPHLAGVLACLWILNKLNFPACKPQIKSRIAEFIDFYFDGSKAAFFMFLFVILASLSLPWMLVFLVPFVWQSRNRLDIPNA